MTLQSPTVSPLSTMASPTGTAGDGSTAPTEDNKDYS